MGYNEINMSDQYRVCLQSTGEDMLVQQCASTGCYILLVVFNVLLWVVKVSALQV